MTKVMVVAPQPQHQTELSHATTCLDGLRQIKVVL